MPANALSGAEMIAWIDRASYADLLRKWRFAPEGDPFFLGAVGDHYVQVLAQRRAEVGPLTAAETSKRLGW